MLAADPMRELVLPRLEGVRPSAGGKFMARCPAHEDGKASLSVGSGDKHPVVLNCMAGCSADDVLAKLGLTWGDLSAPRERSRGDDLWTPAGEAVAVYDYRDENGRLLFQVCRTAKKDFRQRVPDPAAKGGWRWKLGETRRVLYRLPAVIAAVAEGREVWICEGEKDVHSLEGQGVVATCNPGGAGKWKPEYSEFLREAVVCIAADRDEPGQAHARMVRDSLAGVAGYVRIVEAASGKDITDHLNAGHGLDDVEQTWESEAPAKPDLAPDLWEFLATEDAAYDWLVPGLLERGDRLILTGFEGLGKSMLIRQLAVCIAAGLDPFSFEEIEPHRVLLIDCENSERQSRRKFWPMARASERYERRVPDGALRLIHRPEGIDLTREPDSSWLLERVAAHRPDVLFIGPFYRLHAANMNEELPARKTLRVLDAARGAGECALITEAHAGHAETGIKGRSVRPAGSSVLMRWPEFGYGLRPAEGTKDPSRPELVEFARWRGDRDDRAWPSQLKRGDKGWPWLNADLAP